MSTATRTDSTLLDRALRAVHRYRVDAPATFELRFTDWAQWTRRATIVRAITAALDVAPETVTITDDPHRRYGVNGRIAGDLITVICPATGTRWRFVPDLHTAGNAWLLLDTCPECEQPVPAAKVATLADLGDYLDLGGYSLEASPPEFLDDPAHQAGCPATAR